MGEILDSGRVATRLTHPVVKISFDAVEVFSNYQTTLYL